MKCERCGVNIVAIPYLESSVEKRCKWCQILQLREQLAAATAERDAQANLVALAIGLLDEKNETRKKGERVDSEEMKKTRKWVARFIDGVILNYVGDDDLTREALTDGINHELAKDAMLDLQIYLRKRGEPDA